MTNPTATVMIPYHALDALIQRGTRAAQPLAADVVPGTLYSVTDEGYRCERSTGAAWEIFTPGVPGGTVYPYRADTNAITPADPGAGYLRWNTAAQLDATALYVDWLTGDDIDIHVLFQLMTPPARFLIQDIDLAIHYQVWELTAPSINHPDWFEVPVGLVEASASGAVFTHNQRIAVIR